MEAARALTSRAALEHLLGHYVGLVGATSVKGVARLFRCPEERCLRAARALGEAGAIVGDWQNGTSLVTPTLPEATARGA